MLEIVYKRINRNLKLSEILSVTLIIKQWKRSLNLISKKMRERILNRMKMNY